MFGGIPLPGQTTALASPKYLVEVADLSLPNAFAMGGLATGIIKNTSVTGVPSIATFADLPISWGIAGDIGAESSGVAAAAGSTGKVADAGHVHSMPALLALDSGAASASAPGDSATAGSATGASHSDHKHGREAWGGTGDMTAEAIGSTVSAGASGKVSDAAHRHAMPAAGAAGDIGVETFGAAAAAGASGKVADAGHVHSMPVARTKLTGAATYYVRTNGSDSNDGSANDAAHAWLTLQHAIDVATGLDNGGNDITISVAAGTYTGANTLKSFVGSGKIIIVGDESTPANVLINVAGSCFTASAPCVYALRGMKLQASAYGINMTGTGAQISFQNLNFGACTAGCIFSGSAGGLISNTGDWSISGNSAYFVAAWQLGQVQFTTTATCTLTGTPAFSSYFASAGMLSFCAIYFITFSGSATGPRYQVTYNSVMNTNGGGATYLPGNSAGSTSTGGQYL